MGLDMYLTKYPRFDGYSISEIIKIGNNVADNVGKVKGVLNYNLNRQKKDKELKTAALDYIHKYKFLDDTYFFGDEMMYWRKANSIHQFFVDNAQKGIDDCGYYEVTKAVVSDLFDECNQTVKILSSSHKKTKKVQTGIDISGPIYEEFDVYDINPDDLPLAPKSGFFFGSMDIDEYYFNTIKETADTCRKILNDFDFKKNILIYHSSW